MANSKEFWEGQLADIQGFDSLPGQDYKWAVLSRLESEYVEQQLRDRTDVELNEGLTLADVLLAVNGALRFVLETTYLQRVSRILDPGEAVITLRGAAGLEIPSYPGITRGVAFLRSAELSLPHYKNSAGKLIDTAISLLRSDFQQVRFPRYPF